MTEPRKSTVFDYSDLRLHPDGTRVYQKSTNFRPKLAQRTVQDARSNWIARDAGGSVKVPLFKKKGRIEEEEEEKKDGDITARGSIAREDSSVEVDEDACDNGKRRPRRPDHRKAKRQKFLTSDDFLADHSIPNLAEPSDTSSSSLPHPSPDLLKCIHRFASEFYSERGQLLNTSRQYRKERKERKRAMDRGSSVSSQSASSSESQSKNAEKGDGDEDYSEEDTSEGGDVDTTIKRKRKGRHRSDKLYVDMYKVFDGSAMMALGMLVQEQIAYLLKPSIPESWEREIRSAYTDPWGDSPQIQDNGKDGGDSQEDRTDVVDSVASGSDKEQRSGSLKQPANMEGNPNHRSRFEHDSGTSEKENLTDESSRSGDTEHSSSSEGE